MQPNLPHEEIEIYIQDALKGVDIARIAGSRDPFFVSQDHLIKFWWITYLETFQGIRCDKSQFPPADSLADDLNDIIFLHGYLGTRRLQSYYFELPSGSSPLFTTF